MKLQSIVNSLYSVYAEAKVIHWNYTSENFAAIHALSKDIYEFAEGAADTVAERMRFLELEPQILLVDTEYQKDQGFEPLIMVIEEKVADIYNEMNKLDTKKGVNKTTENMLLTITEQLEKFHWLLKSHLPE